MNVIGDWSLTSFVKILLDVTYYVIVLFVVLLAGILGFSLFSDSAGNGTVDVPASVEMDAQTYNVASPSLGLEGAEIQIRDVSAHLRFPARPNAFLFATLSSIAILLVLVLWALAQLRHVFRALRDRQLFLPANARRIRRVGYAVILGELARAVVTYLGSYYTMTHFSATGIRFTASFDISFTPLIHGLMIIIVAEVFKAGSRLEEEQSLTI